MYSSSFFAQLFLNTILPGCALFRTRVCSCHTLTLVNEVGSSCINLVSFFRLGVNSAPEEHNAPLFFSLLMCPPYIGGGLGSGPRFKLEVSTRLDLRCSVMSSIISLSTPFRTVMMLV